MALVSYGVRAAGFAIARALPTTAFFSAFLRHLGASVIVALVATILAAADGAAAAAAVTTLALAARGRPTLGLVAGMALAAVLRRVFA
jgi:branched-subunit amino acid transport protein